MNPEPPNQESPSHHGLGKTFWIVAWLIAMATASFWFAQWEQKQYNPNIATEANNAELRLLRNRLGHYIAQGEINGSPVTFLLDTGATDVVVPADMANTLRLERGASHWVNTANGQRQVYSTNITELSVGGLPLYDIRASLNPGMNGTDEVLLGMSALRYFTLIQQGNELILKPINAF